MNARSIVWAGILGLGGYYLYVHYFSPAARALQASLAAHQAALDIAANGSH